MTLNKQRGFGLLGGLIAIAILLGLGAVAYWYFDEDDDAFNMDDSPMGCEYPTGHDSCIVQGVDSVLLGSWKLVSQTLTAQGHTIPFKFTGSILHFSEGTYTQDYSTSISEETSVVSPDASFTAQCKGEGSISGIFNSFHEYNPSDPHALTELRAKKTSGSIKRLCKNPSGEYVSVGKNIAIPLGVGPDTHTSAGTYVVYKYTVEGSSPITLRMTQTNQHTGVVVESVFKRIE